MGRRCCASPLSHAGRCSPKVAEPSSFNLADNIPQPHKRPKCSYVRFCAELPNERWQADTTHWSLADGTDVEVLNIIDDHSRLLVAFVGLRHHQGR